jgi:endonuclease YncB( thermonuclease family)
LHIRKDTDNWVYAPVVREKRLRVVFAGGTTGWHRNGIMKELLVEFRRLEREAREQGRGLWGKST